MYFFPEITQKPVSSYKSYRKHTRVCYTVIPRFINLSVHEKFGSQIEAFGQILFLFMKSALGDKQGCSHFPCVSTKAAIFSRVKE